MNDLILRLAAMGTQKALVIGLALTAAFYFGVYNDGTQIKAAIQQAKVNIQTEEERAAKLVESIKDFNSLKAKLSSLAEQFQAASQKLPSEMQMTEIISNVDRAAQVSALRLNSKEPQSSIRSTLVETLPLRVVGEGNYNQIAQFVFELAKTERIMRVRSFRLSTPEELTAESLIAFEAEVVSYKFLPQAALGSGEVSQ